MTVFAFIMSVLNQKMNELLYSNKILNYNIDSTFMELVICIVKEIYYSRFSMCFSKHVICHFRLFLIWYEFEKKDLDFFILKTQIGPEYTIGTSPRCQLHCCEL